MSNAPDKIIYSMILNHAVARLADRPSMTCDRAIGDGR
jgi:hypothetical protein